MEMLYILTHTCPEGAYSPVVFNNIHEAFSCLIDKVKQNLKLASNIDVMDATHISIDYADDSFDEYIIFEVQQDTLNVKKIHSLDNVYNVQGLKQLYNTLTEIPSLTGIDTKLDRASYIEYLHQWSIAHKDVAFNGMVPADYNEWRTNELSKGEHSYKLCENDKPITDLYVLLVDSFNGQAKQSFFADKKSAMFACMDIIKQSKNTARDLSICGDSVCVSSTPLMKHIYTLTLSHVNLTTGAYTYVDPNEIAVTYLYATNVKKSI